jgi:hypothetical protein
MLLMDWISVNATTVYMRSSGYVRKVPEFDAVKCGTLVMARSTFLEGIYVNSEGN